MVVSLINQSLSHLCITATTTTTPTSEKIHQIPENCKLQVNTFSTDVISVLIDYLVHRVSNCKAGQVSKYYDEWCTITSDPSILDTISGEKIEWINDAPQQAGYQVNSSNKDHMSDIENEIKALLKAGVIVKTDHEEGDFISLIFSVPKNDCSIRLILNLKTLNDFVKVTHFKM